MNTNLTGPAPEKAPESAPATSPENRYDVAVLGAGMAGGMLAAVLARHGVKVLLLDAGTHPRFAVGESTIPYTSTMTRVIAERYDVPELLPLASFAGVREHVAPMSGRKQNFGFVYHREGHPQDPEQINQLVVPEWQRTETHLFRQDVDAYLFHLAVRHGAEARTATRITEISVDAATGAVLRSDRGEEFHASYVVDGSGFRSPLADAFGLREQPTRARHHSRSLFTHMVGVTPYDDAPSARGHKQPSPWHAGTLHHVFDGGWLWVIPFDNHDGALSPLCSVGLTLDERVFPKGEADAQQEFDAFLARFPQIAEQFQDARAVRPWVSTGRLQYSANRTVGDRFCLTAHAAGFIDALYSRGLTNTMEIVNVLAWRLIEASRDGDWSTERFAHVDRLQQGLFDVHDDVVYSSFVGFRDYELWNAVLRVWEATSIMPTMTLERAYRSFLQSRDDRVFRELEASDTPGLPAPVGADVSALLTFTRETCQAVEAGELASGEAAARILARVEAADFLPRPFALGDRDNRCFEATPELMQRAMEWGRTEAPAHIGALFG
ncbi:NAD(P)/FAD-dependent oxidoreductase [Streptacidiphilus jiangxiensis]|uniref:FADH2 O2-dependent halogenase n=1 Tax=Streptacidiphilus jiangxiensis TaxID=235985 RepID=A0A1H7KIR2_STRJI|nr:tryptophan 7-halogenase [Streptacidiphilus jiangxiensis]SEK86672.1 FADH2 O2-dependent halogenase [Streptacidiphilus jiangxiensis]